MNLITIEKESTILAHHTTESYLSHYGQPVWVVEEKNPEPGPVVWRQDETSITLDILEVRGGWLICRQPNGLLCGVIWSDGEYFANIIVDTNNQPVKKFSPGCHVLNTVQFDADDPDDLGAILAI